MVFAQVPQSPVLCLQSRNAAGTQLHLSKFVEGSYSHWTKSNTPFDHLPSFILSTCGAHWSLLLFISPTYFVPNIVVLASCCTSLHSPVLQSYVGPIWNQLRSKIRSLFQFWMKELVVQSLYSFGAFSPNVPYTLWLPKQQFWKKLSDRNFFQVF